MRLIVKIRKSHRLYFSAAVRCHLSQFDDQANRQAFGPAGAASGAGFNFELRASLEGAVDSETGWMLSESNFDALLWDAVQKWDHCYLNHTEPEFDRANPTLENMVRVLHGRISSLLESRWPHLKLARVSLRQDENIWVDWEGPETPFYLTQVFRVQCVHRHHNPDLTMEENRRLYNKCASLHGHEYKIEVTARGDVSGETGLLMARDLFHEDVERILVQPFNQTFLNDIVGNTSGEILTEKWSQLMRQAWGQKFAYLVVRETRKNSFVEAENGRDQALFLL